MKRLVVLALLGLPLVASSQTVEVRRATLLHAFDLDGEAADADQIVTAANGDLTDSKTFTITADPDVCRLVDMTVTDANSSITDGTLTVAGVGCLGEAKSCTFTFAAGGSGVKTLTCADGSGAYFSDVTSVTTGALTGEGGAGVDLMTLGYTSNSAVGWAMFGAKITAPNGQPGVNPFGSVEVRKAITTSDALSTTVTGVDSDADAFELVSAGDLIEFSVAGQAYERKVTAKASADSVTVNAAVNIPSAGVTFRLRKLYFTTNPAHQAYVPVAGYSTAIFTWSVAANANTGGVTSRLQCSDAQGPDFPTTSWVGIGCSTCDRDENGEQNVASGSSLSPTVDSIDLTLLPFTFCRFGHYFGTGDDADAAAEDIDLSVVLRR